MAVEAAGCLDGFELTGGCRRQVDGTAGLPSAPSGTPAHSVMSINPCVFCAVGFSPAFFQFSHPLPVHSMKLMRETDGRAKKIVYCQCQRFSGHAMDDLIQMPASAGLGHGTLQIRQF